MKVQILVAKFAVFALTYHFTDAGKMVIVCDRYHISPFSLASSHALTEYPSSVFMPRKLA